MCNSLNVNKLTSPLSPFLGPFRPLGPCGPLSLSLRSLPLVGEQQPFVHPQLLFFESTVRS
jgi:hypothetical protein